MKGSAMNTRILSTLSVLTLSAGLLTACGGNSSDAYCSELKSDKAYFDSIGSGTDASKIDEAFDKFHSLAKKAPDEVADDWKVLDDAITTVQKALKDAGVTLRRPGQGRGRPAAQGRRPPEAGRDRAQAPGALRTPSSRRRARRSRSTPRTPAT